MCQSEAFGGLWLALAPGEGKPERSPSRVLPAAGDVGEYVGASGCAQQRAVGGMEMTAGNVDMTRILTWAKNQVGGVPVGSEAPREE